MRRRRTRGTWLPNLGAGITEDGTASASGRIFNIPLPAAFPGEGQPVTIITPLTYDVETGEDADSELSFSLADIIGSEYVLQRIVGKIFIDRVPAVSGGVDISPAALVTAGFFVARANDSSVGGGVDTPIGSATPDERRDNYSPLDTDNVREPWIWRRQWVLGSAGRAKPGGVADTASFTPCNYPTSTALYGSVADGPHIDSKVRRRVISGNRLFFAVTAVQFPFATEITEEFVITGYLDYRLFGSLRKARQTSAF